MMNIIQFKLGGGYDYNIVFETELVKQKIQTDERPKNDLLSAVSSVVTAAVNFFRFENISASFRQIAFSYPENGPDGFVIELFVRTQENVYIKHVMKSERLDLIIDETETTDAGLSVQIDRKNNLVEKIIALREEIEGYALGARMQQDLPFDPEEGPGEEASLFDEREDGGDGPGDEQQHRRSELHIVERGEEA